MSLDPNYLSERAREFFSERTLMNEQKEPVGKLWFKDASGIKTKGQIEIKALNQKERALLHFSVTHELPEGFSINELEGALKSLKMKVDTTGSILYKTSKSLSMTKRIEHAFQKNVIGVDELSATIQKREKEVSQLWSKFKEVVEPLVDKEFLKKLETRFPDNLSRLGEGDYKSALSVDLKQTYKQIVDTFKTDEGSKSEKASHRLWDLCRKFSFATGGINLTLEDAIRKSAFKEAYAMTNSQALQKLNDTKAPLLYIDKQDDSLYLLFKNEFNATIKLTLSEYDKDSLYEKGSKQVLRVRNPEIKAGPFNGSTGSTLLPYKTLTDRINFVADWIVSKENLKSCAKIDIDRLYDFIAGGVFRFDETDRYDMNSLRELETKIINVQDEKSRELLNELVKLFYQRAEEKKSPETENIKPQSSGKADINVTLKRLKPASTAIARLKQVLDLPEQKILTSGYSEDESRAIVEFICGSGNRDEINRERRALVLKIHSDKTLENASDALVAWNALWKSANMTKR